MTPLSPSEHDEQAAVISWARMQECVYPELKLLFCVPNGAALTWREDKKGNRYSPQAARLKAEGLRPGVPDLCLPVARQGYHSLYIELKAGRNRPTQEQIAFLDALACQGHLALVCYGAEQAIEAIKEYLGV